MTLPYTAGIHEYLSVGGLFPFFCLVGAIPYV